MPLNELQRIVFLEAACLVLICAIMVAAFRRWKIIVVIAITLASMTFFTAWSFAMAMGAFLTYISAPTLLLIHLDYKNQSGIIKKMRSWQGIAWATLAIGVVTLIVKNVCNILEYLSH